MDIDGTVRSLLTTTRVAMLATRGEEFPLSSAIPFISLDDWKTLVVHISTLAAHTQNLLRDARVSVLIMEPDGPEKNPLALKRLTLQGTAAPLDSRDPKHATAAHRFLQRFPEAEITLTLADFQFWNLQMTKATLIAGFGQAFAADETNGGWQHQRRR